MESRGVVERLDGGAQGGEEGTPQGTTVKEKENQHLAGKS